MADIRWIVDTAAAGTWTEYDAEYSSLEAAMADAYDLVTAQDSLIIECTDSSGTGANPDTTPVVVDGWITDSTYTITIKAHKNDQHNGVWNDTIYRLATSTTQRPLYQNQSGSVIIGLQVSASAVSNLAAFMVNNGISAENVFIKILDSEQYGVICTASGAFTLSNSIIQNSTRFGIYNNGGNLVLQNVVIEGCVRHGISTNGGTLTCNQVMSINNGDGVTYFDFFGNGTGDNNVSSDLTAPGTNNVQSFVHATLFPNAATGDFAPSISYLSALGTTWGAGAIPWQRDVLVDTSGGGDYTSLSAAEAGEQTIGDDLVLRNEKMVISCTSGGTTTADTTAVTIDATWNTSESCDFTVQAHADDRHNGVWDDNKYQLNVAHYYDNLQTSIDYITINSLQMRLLDYADTSRSCIDIDSTVLCQVNSCLFDCIDIDQAHLRGIFLVNTGKLIAENNIFSSFIGTFNYGIRVNNAVARIENNTAYNCYAGFNNSSGTVSGINNVAINCLTDFVGSFEASSTTNISSDGTAPDNSISYTVYDAALDTLPVVPENCVIFKDIVANDFRLVSHFVEDYTGTMVETNSAIGNGTYLADVLDDVAGKSRQPYDYLGVRTQRSFDIGAWQAPVALTYLVDTDGVSGDYSSLAAGFAGLQSDSVDLVTDNLLPTIQCQASTGLADTTAVNITGIGTSADCFIAVKAAEGHRHSYIWDDTKYRLSVTTTATYQYEYLISCAFVKTSFMQFNRPYTHNETRTIIIDNLSAFDDNLITLESNIIRGICATDNCLGYGLRMENQSNNVILNNNIVYGFLDATNTSGTGLNLSGTSDLERIIANNNTAYGCYRGFYDGNYHSAIGSNNVSVGNYSLDFGGIWDSKFIGAVSSDLTGDITGLLDTYFVDPANGDFTPVTSAGDLTSHGANLDATASVGAIPFVDEKIVDTGGTGDYISINTWEAYAQNAVVNGETAKATCMNSDGQADVVDTFIDGWPLGSLCVITVDENYKHNGVWDNSKYRWDTPSADDSLEIKLAATIIEYIQINLVEGAINDYMPLVVDAPNCIIRNCLIKQTSVGNGYERGINFRVGSDDSAAINNIFYGMTFSIYGAGIVSVGTRILIKNNSMFDCTHGISLDSGSAYVVNNIIVNSSGDDFYGDAAGYLIANHNVSSDATANTVGTDSVINQINWATDFESIIAGSEDFHTTDSPFALWGVDAAYAGAFGDEPYEILRTVDMDGVSGDYSNLKLAVDAHYGVDLVTRNEAIVIECADSTGITPDTSNVSCSALTSDSTRSITIRPAVSDQHEGIWDDTKYNLIGDDTASKLQVNSRVTKIIGLQIASLGTTIRPALIFSCAREATGIGFVDSCIIKVNNATHNPIIFTTYAHEGIVHNCVIYNEHPTGDEGIIFAAPSGRNYVVRNCVVYGFNDGIERDVGVASVINSAVFNNDDDFDLVTSITNCASDDGDGINPLTPVWADCFADYTNFDFRLKANSPLIGAGIDQSAFLTKDVVDNDRTTWDIGPFLYVVGGSGGSAQALIDGVAAVVSTGKKVGADQAIAATLGIVTSVGIKAVTAQAAVAATDVATSVGNKTAIGDSVVVGNSQIVVVVLGVASDAATVGGIAAVVSVGNKIVSGIADVQEIPIVGVESHKESLSAATITEISTVSSAVSKAAASTASIVASSDVLVSVIKITSGIADIIDSAIVTAIGFKAGSGVGNAIVDGLAEAVSVGSKLVTGQSDATESSNVTALVIKAAISTSLVSGVPDVVSIGNVKWLYPAGAAIVDGNAVLSSVGYKISIKVVDAVGNAIIGNVGIKTASGVVLIAGSAAVATAGYVTIVWPRDDVIVIGQAANISLGLKTTLGQVEVRGDPAPTATGFKAVVLNADVIGSASVIALGYDLTTAVEFVDIVFAYNENNAILTLVSPDIVFTLVDN